MAGSNADARAEARRSRRKTTVLLVAALCVAAVTVLVAQAGAYTRTVNRVGGTGTGTENFHLPGGIAVSPDGTRVYVADAGNDRIAEFEADGTFLRVWGWGVLDNKAQLETCSSECLVGQFGPGEGQLDEPSAIAVAPDGTVYVVNHARFDGRVLAFDPSGPEVTYAGELPAGYGRTGPEEVGFSYPLPYSNDIAVDEEGKVYVGDNPEAGGSQIDVFDPETGLSTSIEVNGLENDMVAFAITPDGQRVWATERYGTTVLLNRSGKVLTLIKGRGSFSALAVRPGAEERLVAEAAGFTENREEVLFQEFDPAGEKLGQFMVNQMTFSYDEPTPYGIAFNPGFRFVNEYEPENKNEQGVMYVTDRFGGAFNIVAEATPGEPIFEGLTYNEASSGAADVGATGATLFAAANPKGLDTHVYFEYGTTANYGSTTPALPGLDLGNGFAAKKASTRLAGLQPNTTYHFAAVATNAAGTKVSADDTFTTFPVGGPFSLPDGRAYELATPDKGPNNVVGNFAAPAGGGVAFTSPTGALPGSDSGGLQSAYVGFRGSAGWSREAASVPVSSAPASNTLLISPDLSQTVGSSTRALTPGATAGENLYLRDNATGALTLMTPAKAASSYIGAHVYGVSADFRHIFIRSFVALTPDTPETFSENLFEFSNGTLRNVGILPGATTPTTNIAGTSAAYPVSADGSRVFFTTEPAPGAANRVFARIDDSRTVEISASQRAETDEEAAQQAASFAGATPDGSVAYFTSSARLTDDAFTGSNSETGEPEDREPNLYRYDFASGRLTDITVADDQTNAELGAAVIGNVLVAAGGNSVYFVAQGDLAAGASLGKPNLYRWERGGGIRFIATLNGGDHLAEPGTMPGIARTTADGSVLAFTSSTALDPAFPKVEGTNPENFQPLTEIYRWSTAEGRVVCVSCARFGNGRPFNAQISPPSEYSAGYGGNVLSPDGGRLVFQTAAALLPQDSNGRSDVYEWENGSPLLISTGAGSGATLVDASVSGEDVFFNTADQLTPGDEGDYTDVYDAKVGGGFPGPSPAAPPCEGEACLPPSQGAPSPGGAGSRSFHGPGDKKAKHHRKKHKRHHKKHKRGKHRKQKKHRKHTRSHGHPAVGKRG